MAIHIRVDTTDVMRALRRLAKEDAPIVTAYALTKTAQDIKTDEIETMKNVFDRPTRFTLNALYVKPAKKKDLVAEVFFKDKSIVSTGHYLDAQVHGGARVHKAHEKRLIVAGHMKPDEFAVPGKGAKLDAYGNMSGSTIERILSQVRAAEQWAGYDANATNSRRSKAKRKKTGNYFVLRPELVGPSGRNVAPGVYFRAPGSKSMVPVIMFVKAPRYQKRFPFYERAQLVFNERMLGHARDGFERFVLSKLSKAA